MARERPKLIMPDEGNGNGGWDPDNPLDPFQDLPPPRRYGQDPETSPNKPVNAPLGVGDAFVNQIKAGKMKLWIIAAIAAAVLYFMNK